MYRLKATLLGRLAAKLLVYGKINRGLQNEHSGYTAVGNIERQP